MTRPLKIVAMLSTATVVLACSSSPFVSSWQDPGATPVVVSGAKIAAIAMVQQDINRRAAEDAIARELTARGAMGVALYTVLPDATPSNEAAVRAALEQAGFAGVVVMRPVGTDTEVVSTPVMYTGPTYGGFWGGYYGYGWGAPYMGVSGGEIRTNKIVSVETMVYSLRQNKLVWGGTSKTTNPASVDKLVKDTATKVSRELDRLGLIAG